MSEFHVVNSKHSLDCFIDDCRRRFEQDHYHEYEWRTKEKHRTLTQNAAIHLYCERLAQRLNAAGFERIISSEVLSKPVECPWSKESVKESIWLPVMLAVTGHGSTRDLNTKEVGEIYEIIHRHLAQNFGIECEFPHRESE